MTLRSSVHHKSKTDVAGFARLTLEIVNANASVALKLLQEGYEHNTHPELKGALEDCRVSYNMLVKVHLREALIAMDIGDYKVVKQRTYAAGLQAQSCDNKFKGSKVSPLKDTNRYVQNLCAIALSIVNRLIQPNQATLT
ncbi:Pectinesterase inhibitor domain [Sesbania bispinosa]|nr:Pectinesterase inhibitor domain [Sesbania bispinosa]